eukprot:m.34336 g.34336  ORF g.34336 m.34336 type:complete len:67 (-) comp8708_c0_seq2:235-435(-)
MTINYEFCSLVINSDCVGERTTKPWKASRGVWPLLHIKCGFNLGNGSRQAPHGLGRRIRLAAFSIR